MIEDYDYKPEELSEISGLKEQEGLSENQLEYLNEILPMNNYEILADRIDELSNIKPPKAIDANREIADLIEPLKDQIDNKHLEAPNDSIQIEQVSDVMCDIEGLKYEEWKELSFDQRMETLNKLECTIAEITHRPASSVFTENLDEGSFGYFDPESKNIVINSKYINSGSMADYKEVLNTLIHEGRHAYQEYNLNEREVHPREGDLTNWKLNEFEFGYKDPGKFGFEAYAMQPVEADARAFAEDVLNQFNKKIS